MCHETAISWSRMQTVLLYLHQVMHTSFYSVTAVDNLLAKCAMISGSVDIPANSKSQNIYGIVGTIKLLSGEC